MTAISMLINGERVQATGGATFERRNPLDGSVATTAPAARRTNVMTNRRRNGRDITASAMVGVIA